MFGFRTRVRTSIAAVVTTALMLSGVSVAVADTEGADNAEGTVVSAVTASLSDLDDVQPVEIGVEAADGSYVPEGSDEPVQLPIGPSGEQVGFELPVEDVSAVITEGGSAVYADENSGVEFSVQSVDTVDIEGVDAALRALITIPNADAPSEYEFPLDLPEGAQISWVDDGLVVENTAGEVLSVIGVPWAVDADGEDLPTWYEVRGDTLVQHVQHQGAAYPVIADPIWFVPVALTTGRIVYAVVRANTAAAARTTAVQAAKKAGHTTAKKVAGSAVKAQMKSYTKANARHNLSVRTGKNPKNCQAHHVMPTKFAKQFADKKININNPSYLVWWNSTPGLANSHQKLAYQYNQEWEKWFKTNKNASAQAMLKQYTQMNNKYRKYYNC